VNYGSFNATFINATRLLQGGNAILLSRDFNLGNISNYTQYATQSNVRTNITDYLGGQNGSLILTGNLTTLDTLNLYTRSRDFNLGNISNYTQYATQANVRTNISDYLGGQNSSLILTGNLTTLNTLDLYIRVKDFNIGNISNNTGLNVNNNNTMALWNISIPDSATQIQIFPRFTNSTIQIGNFNQSLNYTDILTILGSVVTYGSFNATSINATRITIGGAAIADLTVYGSVSAYKSLNASSINATTLTVTGQGTVYGSLNATNINSTKLRVNTNAADSTVNIQGNISVTGNFNNTIGNMTMGQFNSSCVGFRAGTTGGWILSCSP
jgi:hypothetical protein